MVAIGIAFCRNQSRGDASRSSELHLYVINTVNKRQRKPGDENIHIQEVALYIYMCINLEKVKPHMNAIRHITI